MEEKKNNNLLTIILVILLIIAVGVIGYLLGSNNVKDDNNKENPTEEKENNSETTTEQENTITPVNYTPKCNSYNTNYLVDIDETKYNNISEYIQKQANVKVTLGYFPNIDSDEKEYNLTDSEKNNLLKEMKNATFSITESGFGGAGVPSLKISYERNDKQYYVSFWGFSLMKSNDGNIYKIIDKSVSNTLSYPEYCVYLFKNLSSEVNSIEKRLLAN